MGWVIRTYHEDTDELVRELDLDHLGPRDRPVDKTGSIFLGTVGQLHSYLDWDDPGEPVVTCGTVGNEEEELEEYVAEAAA